MKGFGRVRMNSGLPGLDYKSIERVTSGVSKTKKGFGGRLRIISLPKDVGKGSDVHVESDETGFWGLKSASGDGEKLDSRDGDARKCFGHKGIMCF